MTAPGGPGFDVELLAALDAELLDAEPPNADPLAAERAERAGRALAAAAADPAAAATLDALVATRAELAMLPETPLPAGLAARWTAALQAAGVASGRTTQVGAGGEPPAGPPPPPHRVDTPRESRGPARRPFRVVRAAAAALLLVILTAGLLWPRPDPAEPDRTHPSTVELVAAGRSALGHTDLGALADPARRAGCLRAAGVLGLNPDTPPLAGRRVELARGPGVLLVFPTGRRGVFDVIVVDPDCGPGAGTLLGTARIGQ